MPAFTSLALRAANGHLTRRLSLVDAALTQHTRSVEEFVHRCFTCNEHLAENLTQRIGGALR